MGLIWGANTTLFLKDDNVLFVRQTLSHLRLSSFPTDLMQGCNSTEAFATLPEQLRGLEEEMNDNVTPWSLDKEEHVVDSVIRCRTELYPDKNMRVQGWMLTEAAGYR